MAANVGSTISVAVGVGVGSGAAELGGGVSDRVEVAGISREAARDGPTLGTAGPGAHAVKTITTTASRRIVQEWRAAFGAASALEGRTLTWRIELQAESGLGRLRPAPPRRSAPGRAAGLWLRLACSRRGFPEIEAHVRVKVRAESD